MIYITQTKLQVDVEQHGLFFSCKRIIELLDLINGFAENRFFWIWITSETQMENIFATSYEVIEDSFGHEYVALENVEQVFAQCDDSWQCNRAVLNSVQNWHWTSPYWPIRKYKLFIYSNAK